jgi:hypothetical protein
MIIEIAGKRVQVDDSFKDLSEEDQQAQVDLIANKLASGEGESASEYDVVKPAAGAVIGTTAGAVLGPAAGSAVDVITEKMAQKTLGPDKAKNQAIANWLKTQTTGPDVGGATYKDAFKKSETARGVPIQSRGSQIPIRKGFLGIENQPTPPSLPQKTAANIMEGERLNKPSIPRRVAGMGVAGAEAGKMISDLEQGNMFDAAVSGLGTAGGVMSQSRIKPIRALGTGISLLVPMFQGGKEAKELIYPNQPKDEEVQKKAMGGSVTPSPKLKSLSDFLDQLMQQASAPTPAPAPMAPPQGGLPPGMPPPGGMPPQRAPGIPGMPPQQPPMQQSPMQQSPLNAMMPQMASGGLVHLAKGKLVKKLSEVLVPREGQTIIGTMADRTKATEGFSGGPGFINLHPEYTWAMDAPGAANRLLNVVNAAGGPERTVVAPMLMSRTAHKSNRPVFEKIYKELQEDIRSGKVTPQQVEALNKRLAAEKGLETSPGIDSKDFLEFANAFHRRGSVADIFGKKRIGAVDLQRHLDETIDPALRESELGAIGPQLFTAESQLLRPDVHPGYRQVITGQKGEDQFTPVPREFLFRDLESKAMKELGRPLSDYNYRTSVGVPSQRIDEKLIRSLEELGYKKGGLV